MGKTEENRTLGRPWRTWEYSIKKVLRKWDGRAWAGLV
jgi:hypothetical protein